MFFQLIYLLPHDDNYDDEVGIRETRAGARDADASRALGTCFFLFTFLTILMFFYS